MVYKIKSEDGQVALMQPVQIVQLLMGKVMDDGREDFLPLSHLLVDYLERNELLSQTTPYALAETAFAIGYFYKVFLAKNNVEIEGINEPKSSNDSNQPNN